MSVWEKNFLAADINDRSVGLLTFLNDKAQAAFVFLEPGLVGQGTIADSRKLADKLKEALNKLPTPEHTGLIPAAACFPDSAAKTYCFELPANLKGVELEQAILNKIKTPLDGRIEDYYWDYLIRPMGESQAVLFAAVVRSEADVWRESFRVAGLELSILDLEMLSYLRAGVAPDGLEHSLVINLDAGATHLGFADEQGFLRLTGCLPMGVEALKGAVAAEMEIELSEAENLINDWGLRPTLKNKVREILEVKLKTLSRGINRAIGYYENKLGAKVGAVYLAGSGAGLVGLDKLMSKELTRRTEPINSFSRFGIKPTVERDLPTVSFAKAMGLYRINQEKSLPHLNLCCPPETSVAAPEIKDKFFLLVNFFRASAWFAWLFFSAAIIYLGVVTYGQIDQIIHPVYRATTELPPLLDEVSDQPETPTLTAATSSSAAATSTAPVAPTSSLPLAEVLPTPTGWLNVRSGPGTTYESVIKVNPGQSFELLAEQAGWYKLKISETADGWASAQYLKKK